MKFPRNADGTLNFSAFSHLSPAEQRLAFTDLKENGTDDERRAFQAFRVQIAEAKEALRRMQELKEESQRLEAEIIENKKELLFSARELTSKVVEELQKPSSQYKRTGINKQ